MPGHRIDGHVEQSRADMGEGGGLGQCIGVDGENIQVRQGKTHGIVPDAMQLIFPVPAGPVELNNQRRFGRVLAARIGCRSGIAAGRDGTIRRHAGLVFETRADHGLNDRGGLVAGLEARDIDGVPVGTHGQCARRIGEKAHDPERRSPKAVAGAGRIKYPHVRPRNATRSELRIARSRNAGEGRIGALLAPMRGSDKGSCGGARKYDIARLVADQQGADDAGRTRQTHDTDAVRQVIDHPDFAVAARGDRNRLHSHRNTRLKCQTGGGDIEYLECAIGRIDREQCVPIGRHGDGTNLSAFKLDERWPVRGRRNMVVGKYCAPKGESDKKDGQKHAANFESDSWGNISAHDKTP